MPGYPAAMPGVIPGVSSGMPGVLPGMSGAMPGAVPGAVPSAMPVGIGAMQPGFPQPGIAATPGLHAAQLEALRRQQQQQAIVRQALMASAVSNAGQVRRQFNSQVNHHQVIQSGSLQATWQVVGF